MIKLLSCTALLFVVFSSLLSQQVLAQTRSVDFHTYSSASPETGVQAKIRIIFPDQTTLEFKTPKNGRASMPLRRCDRTVAIEARSVWGDHTKATTHCDPVPVEIAMVPTVQAHLIEKIIKNLDTEEPPLDGPEVRQKYSALLTAVKNQDVVRAAAAANDLQLTLSSIGEMDLAYEYGVFAQSVGFKVLENEEIVFSPFDGTDVKQWMSIDYDQETVVMSEEGKSALAKAQRELGTKESGIWDSETFQALESIQNK